MTIGATTGKEPDYIDDHDLRTPEQLRGDMKDIIAAKKSLGELATIEGIRTQITILQQQMEKTHEQLGRLIQMYGTMKAEFDQFKMQRVRELNVRVNHGPTTSEDD